MVSIKKIFGFGKGAKEDEVLSDQDLRIMESIAEAAKYTKAAAEAEVREEQEVMLAEDEVIEIVEEVSNKESIKGTIGEEVKILEEAKAQAEKKIAVLGAELDKSQRILTSIIDGLDREHKSVAEKIGRMEKKKKGFSALEKKLREDIDSYQDVLGSVDNGQKIKELENVEARLESLQKKRFDVKLLEAISKAESYCEYLEHLRERISGTVKNIQGEMSPEWKEKRYVDMVAGLARMQKLIHEQLAPSAAEHKRIVVTVWQKLRDLDSLVKGVKQSELETLRIEHIARAEHAEEQALAAERKAAMLEKSLTESAAENMQLKRDMLIADSSLSELNEKFREWISNLKSVKKDAESNPASAPTIHLVLQDNVEKLEETVAKLRSLITSQGKYIDSCENRLKMKQEETAELKRQIQSIDEDNKERQAAVRAASEQMAALNERIGELEKEKARLEADMRRADEKKRAEYEKRISVLNSESRDAGLKIAELTAEIKLMDERCLMLENRLEETQNKLKDAESQVPGLETELKTAKEIIGNHKAMFERVSKEKDAEIKELNSKVDSLNSSVNDLKSDLTAKEKQILKLKRDIEELELTRQEREKELEEKIEEEKATAEFAYEELDKKILESGEESASQLRAEEALHHAIEELMDKNAALIKSEAEKAILAAKRAEELENLQKMNQSVAENTQKNQEEYELQKQVLEAMIDKLKHKKTILETELKNLSAVSEEDKAEKIRLKGEIENRTKKIEQLMKELAINRKELDAQKRRALEAELNSAKLRDAVETAILERKRAEEELVAKEDEHKKRMERLQSRIDELNGKVAELERESNDTSKTVALLYEQDAEKEDLLDKSEKERTRLGELLREVQKKIDENELQIGQHAETNRLLKERQELLERQVIEERRLLEKESGEKDAILKHISTLQDEIVKRDKVIVQHIEAKRLIEERQILLEQQADERKALLTAESKEKEEILRKIRELQERIAEKDAEINAQLENRRLIEERQRLLEEQVSEKEKLIESESEEKASILNEITRLKEAIARKDAEISSHIKDKRVADEREALLKEQAREREDLLRVTAEERSALADRKKHLEDQTVLLVEELDKLNEISNMNEELIQENQKLAEELANLKNAYEAEIEVLSGKVRSLTTELHSAKDTRERLNEEANELKKQIMELHMAGHEKDMQKKEVHRLNSLIKEKEDKIKELEVGYSETSKEYAAAVDRIKKLQDQIRLLDALEDAKAGEERVSEDRKAKLKRKLQFDEILREIDDKIKIAEKSKHEDPKSALSELDKCMKIIDNLKEFERADPKNKLSAYENSSINFWLRHIKRTRAEIEYIIQEEMRSDDGRNMIRPKGLGVLAPLKTEGYEWLITQFHDSECKRGESIRMIPLDYSKKRMLFGRTRENDPSKLKDERCDIVFTGPIGSIRQISREHFAITANESGYTLEALGSNPIFVVLEPEKEYTLLGKDNKWHSFKLPIDEEAEQLGIEQLKKDFGGTEITLLVLREKRSILLDEKMTIFIDPDLEFGLVFRFMKIHELGKGHVEWVKTAVSFAERNGYLEVPSHAKVDLISSEGKAKDISDRMIPLNKHEISIGKGKDVQIRVKAAEEYGAGMISDRHTRIICEGNHYVLENTGEYRTFVNYRQVEGKYRLMQGDIIHIGKNEPLLFIFRTRMDKIPESREWERFDVSFRYEKFECPDVKQAVGVLYFPENIIIAIENEKGIQKSRGKEKILLNKYAVSIGAGINNDISIMEVDFHMKDSKGESCSTHVKEKMIGIVRRFGQEYTLRVLSDEAAVRVKTSKGDVMRPTETGSAKGMTEYSLTDGNIIEFLDNPGSFLIFKVEELDLTREDHWLKTMMKVKHSERLETPEMVRKTIKVASVEQGSVWNRLKGIFKKND